MERIVTLTMNPSIDISSSVEHVIADRKLRCTLPRYEPGGGGINISRAIRRLGGNSSALYPAGGTFGQMLQNLLEQESIPHYLIQIEESTRETFMILEESSGRQFRFGMPGPTLRETEWKRCLGTLVALDLKPNFVVASGSLSPGVPEDFYAQLAQITSELGARLIVDTSGEPLRLASQAGVYLLKPNMNEIQNLVGREIQNELELEEMAREFVEKGHSEGIIISLGAGGALMVSKDKCEHVRAPTVPIKSRVGAGDSMVAGIVLGLANGKSLGEAVRFGVAAGTAAVMTPGTELCRREDTERLYQQISVQTHGALEGG
jgi:6-phosphofructokinase 2